MALATSKISRDEGFEADPIYTPPKPFRPLHEQGFGAKCNKCKEKCEGFDLHFWRKICKNCKCPKEEHDVKEDDEQTRRKVGRLFPEKDNLGIARFLAKGTDLDSTKSHAGSLPGRGSKVNGEDAGGAGVGDSVGRGGALFPDTQSGMTSDGSGDAKTTAEMYTWTPPNTSDDLAWQYMQKLPRDERPVEGTVGAAVRQKRLAHQLPEHDQDPSVCHNLSEPEIKKLNAFVEMYKKDAIGIGHVAKTPLATLHPPPTILGAGRNMATAGVGVQTEQQWSCEQCLQPMSPGDVAVFADRAGDEKCWHPSCFVCTKCNELLVDLIYFYKGGKIYCGRHFADTLKARCAACDELIFAKEYTQAEGQNWHLKHFCCWHCDKPLGGHRYVAKEGKPYCLDCYRTQLARVCNTCKQKITADALRLSYESLDWHATPECFHCSYCEKSLIEQPFMCKQGMIFCSIECKRKVVPPSATMTPQRTSGATAL